jgi:hypothetical protein
MMLVLALFIMKLFLFLFTLFTAISPAFSQGDLDRLVNTERSFAKMALDKNTRAAFLEYMAGDALVFVPDRTNAKEYWTARPENTSALVWAPNFGDISTNGILGYTTGNWEFRPKGISDQPTAFGNFVTVWLRQPSGKYRWVVDIGVGHDKPEKYTEEFTPAGPAGTGNPRHFSAADTANRFFELANSVGLAKAYQQFADENMRFYRENEFPGTGRDALLKRTKKSKGSYVFPKRSVFFESDDIAYVNNTYRIISGDQELEGGNFLQIWKFAGGRWRIVLDVFKPTRQVPTK